MRKQRVKYAKEPVLHIHRYVVAISRESKGLYRTRYYYVETKKEARKLAHSTKPGTLAEIYSAVHNYVEGFI